MPNKTTGSPDSTADLKALVESQQGQIQQLIQENKLLYQKIQLLMGRMFGRKSEKLNDAQLELLLGELGIKPKDKDDDPPPSDPKPGKRRGKRKPRMPEDLPTEEIVIEPDDVKASPENYQRIGQEVCEELDVVLPKYFRRRIIRPKYKSKVDRDMPPIIAPLPGRIIEGGYASPGIVADITIKKYQDHLPLYRQEQILKTRYGIDLSRQVMDDWIKAAANWLSPIYRLLRSNLQSRNYLQVDETPVKYCDKDGPPGSRQGYFWVYHDPWTKEVLYEWQKGRGAKCLEGVLDDFSGIVQCDGYSAYISYTKDKEHIELAGCWAHARRKFFEARIQEPAVAGWFLKQIGCLYAIEADLRETSASINRRKQLREQSSHSILRLLKKALQAKQATYLPKSPLRTAIHYALGHWDALARYADNGLVEIDNNGVENAVRPTALGKKNWLFIGHPEAGDRSAIIYTIIENCKKLGINSHEYIKDVLSRLPSMKNHQVEQLLPVNWLATRTAKAA
jgi:transposase